MANLVPLVTVPLSGSDLTDVMNWLITQVASVYGVGGTSGTPYGGGPTRFPVAGAGP